MHTMCKIVPVGDSGKWTLQYHKLMLFAKEVRGVNMIGVDPQVGLDPNISISYIFKTTLDDEVTAPSVYHHFCTRLLFASAANDLLCIHPDYFADLKQRHFDVSAHGYNQPSTTIELTDAKPPSWQIQRPRWTVI